MYKKTNKTNKNTAGGICYLQLLYFPPSYNLQTCRSGVWRLICLYDRRYAAYSCSLFLDTVLKFALNYESRCGMFTTVVIEWMHSGCTRQLLMCTLPAVCISKRSCKHYDHCCASLPIPVATRSKAYVCGRSPAVIVSSNPSGVMDVCLLWVLCVVR